MRQGPMPRAERPAVVRLKSLVTRHISTGLPRKEEWRAVEVEVEVETILVGLGEVVGHILRKWIEGPSFWVSVGSDEVSSDNCATRRISSIDIWTHRWNNPVKCTMTSDEASFTRG